MYPIKTAKLTFYELYNLRQDIGEQHYIAKEKPEILSKLFKALRQKYLEVKTEGLAWEFAKKTSILPLYPPRKSHNVFQVLPRISMSTPITLPPIHHTIPFITLVYSNL